MTRATQTRLPLARRMSRLGTETAFEVLVKARAFREPVSNQRRLVCAVVVHDDVNVESLRDARVDQIERLSKLWRAVPLMELR